MAGHNKQFDVVIYNYFNESVMVKISAEKLRVATPTAGFQRVIEGGSSIRSLEFPTMVMTVYVYVFSESGCQLATGFPIGAVPSRITVTTRGTVECERFEAKTRQGNNSSALDGNVAFEYEPSERPQEIDMELVSSCSETCTEFICGIPSCLYETFCQCCNCDCCDSSD